MEQRILDLMKRRYATAAHPVLLLDETGTLLWQQSSELPESVISQIVKHCQEGTCGTQYFPLNEIVHRCESYFDAQEGFWIVELLPYEGEMIRPDLDVMTSAVQGITSSCKSLEAQLDDVELYDAMEDLNLILASGIRLYRAAYLQKELDRYRTGGSRKDYLSVNTQMRTLYKSVRNILRACADVTLEEKTEEVTFVGDTDQLQIAVLSALVLCYRDTEHYQKVELSVEEEEGMARCTVSVKPIDIPLPANVHGMNRQNSTLYDTEMLMLQLFTELHAGSWMMAEQKETGERICQITFQSTVLDRNLTLHSAKELSESYFFNKYELLLSRIRCQRYY